MPCVDFIQLFLQSPIGLVVEALILAAVIRLLKDDTTLPTIPKRIRALGALMLGIPYAVVLQHAGGMSWEQATHYGLMAALLAIGGHDVVIEGFRAGKELPVPKFLRNDKPGLDSGSGDPPAP